MAALLKRTLDKRRNRTSSSDESNTSPEAKKPKSGNVDLNKEIEEEETDDDDEIFAALNMAEGLQQTLSEINRKLEKLDNIQRAVNVVQESLQKLELRIQSLESSQSTASRDIENLKTNLNDTAKKHLESTVSLDKYQKKTEQTLANLQEENEAFQAKLKELEDKNLYLEAYSRCENLKFENIVEECDGREDTESILRDFLETELGLEDATTVEIQRVHRMGKKKDEKPRPIIARFLRYKDCERILSRGHRLRGSDFKMYQDLPYEIVARRKKQMDTFKTARKNNIPASFSKAQPDKLFIRGKLWPSGKILEL